MFGGSSRVQKKKGKGKKVDEKLCIGDFFDPTKPWDLRYRLSDDSIEKALRYLPKHLIEGPWKPLVTSTMIFLVCLVFYLTIDANIKYASSSDKDITIEFLGDKSYSAFNMAWCYNASIFCWMLYVCFAIYNKYSGFGPWIFFTLWSWTIMCIRHGLCALAPFLPSARILIGMLRFPVLLSSSITFGVWNFMLMPLIAIGFLEGKRRSNFLRFSFSWTMCQVHLLNIVFAYLNCVWAEPNAQGLHLGDVNAGVVYITTYMLFYYFILDRIGVQIYPIFSPRTYIAIPSFFTTAGICVGNYIYWNKMLSVGK